MAARGWSSHYGGDWNEEVSTYSWCLFWNILCLVSPAGLIQRPPTSTYYHGHKQQDLVYISPSLHQVASGYITFNDSIIGADHSAVWLDVPSIAIHLQSPPPHLTKGCQLKMDNPTICNTYLSLWGSSGWDRSVPDGGYGFDSHTGCKFCTCHTCPDPHDGVGTTPWQRKTL